MAIHEGSSLSDVAAYPQTPDDRMLDYMADFVFSVEDRLDELHMTRADLARKLGCRKSQVSRVLSGTENVTLKTIAHYDAILHLNLELRPATRAASAEWGNWSGAIPNPWKHYDGDKTRQETRASS